LHAILFLGEKELFFVGAKVRNMIGINQTLNKRGVFVRNWEKYCIMKMRTALAWMIFFTKLELKEEISNLKYKI